MDSQVKPGYKYTELGIIPEDWEIHSLKNLNFDISDGNYSSKYPKSSEFCDFGVPFIRANNIKKMKIDDNDMRFITKSLHSELLKGHLKKNDILVTTRGEIGQIAFVPDRHIDSNINAQLVRLNTNNSCFDNCYIGYFLSFDIAQKQFLDLQTGSALKQLPVNRLTSLQIILPPKIAEQEKIAEALSDVDSLIESLEDLIAKKRNIKQGTMQELLTGKRRLSGFGQNAVYKQTELGLIPKDWKTKKLNGILTIIGGGAFKSRDSQTLGIKWLKIANVGLNKIIWEEEDFLPTEFSKNYPMFVLKDGDYVLALTRPILGTYLKIAQIKSQDSPCLLNQRVGKIEANDHCDANYIYFLLQSYHIISLIQQSMAGTDPPNLSIKSLYEITIQVPPTKAEQEAIAEVLTDMDNEITALEEKLQKTRHLKQGMMQELLTGKIRLI